MQPVRFRLYPEPKSRLYVLCQVWPTRAAFRQYAVRELGLRGATRTIACCSPYDRYTVHDDGHVRIKPVFAECNFYRARIGTEIITHELFHATLAWARRIRFDFGRLSWNANPINADEERLTHGHSTLCREFVARAHALGLYD